MAFAILLCAITGLVVPAAAPAAAPFSWSAPQAINGQPPFAEPANLAVACPSSSLCVGIDDLGNVLTSSNPAGGSGTWTSTSVRPSDSINGFTSIFCPSASLCVAVDGSSNVATSTNPTGGASAWTVGRIEGSVGFGSVTCPSSTLCLATGGSESGANLAYSTNPAAGASGWQMINVGEEAGLNRVDCASESLCVATEEFGGAIHTSTNPTGGSGAWAKTTLDGNPLLKAVACPSTTLCVLGSTGGVITSTDPTGGPGTWNAAAIGEVRRITCVSASLCVGLQSDHLISSTDPTGGAGAWAASSVTLSTDPSRGISCPTTALCVVALGPNIAYSTEPTNAGASGWTEEVVDQAGTTGLTSMACPSSSLCLVGDEMGRVLVSTSPTGGPSAWDRIELVASSPSIKGISCPTVSFCVAVSSSDVYTSTSPTSPASWSKAEFFGPSFTGVDCPSASFCVAVDSDGKVWTSTNPTGGTEAWQSAPVDPDTEGWGTLGGPTVACASDSLCLVINSRSGNVASSTNPTGGAEAWSLASLGEGLGAVSCPAITFCVIAAGYPAYKVWTASNPADGTAWSPSSLTEIGAAALSCPTTTFCAAGGFIGPPGNANNVAVTTDPAGGGSTWQGTDTNPDFHGSRHTLSIDCPSSELCLLGGAQGNLYIGTPGEEKGGGGEEGGSEETEGATTPFPASGDSDGQPVLPPAPPPVPGTAFFASTGVVRGNKVLIRIRCGGDTACRGVARLIARVKQRRAVKRRSNRRLARRFKKVLVGKGRFSLAPRKAGVLRIRLTGSGKKMLRRSGRRGLRVKLVGRGLKNRVIKLKPRRAKKRRRSKGAKAQAALSSPGARLPRSSSLEQTCIRAGLSRPRIREALVVAPGERKKQTFRYEGRYRPMPEVCHGLYRRIAKIRVKNREP